MYANLEGFEDIFTVGLNRAVTLIAEKAAGGGKSRFQRQAATVLKELGEHPSEGGKIQVLSGRYGPYISHNKINANIPKGKEPADVTVDEAMGLLAERIAKGDFKKGGFKKPKAAPKAKAKSKDAGAEKAGAKSAAPKKPASKTAAKAPAKAAAKAPVKSKTKAAKPEAAE